MGITCLNSHNLSGNKSTRKIYLFPSINQEYEFINSLPKY